MVAESGQVMMAMGRFPPAQRSSALVDETDDLLASTPRFTHPEALSRLRLRELVWKRYGMLILTWVGGLPTLLISARTGTTARELTIDERSECANAACVRVGVMPACMSLRVTDSNPSFIVNTQRVLLCHRRSHAAQQPGKPPPPAAATTWSVHHAVTTTLGP